MRAVHDDYGASQRRTLAHVLAIQGMDLWRTGDFPALGNKIGRSFCDQPNLKGADWKNKCNHSAFGADAESIVTIGLEGVACCSAYLKLG